MRVRTIGFSVICAGLLVGACANTVPPFEGNDTGGIIAWSPEAHQLRHQLAAAHCAQYSKLHRITSVRALYGDYIGFACYWPRGMGSEIAIVRGAY